jgi:phosphoribosylformimino-5-aminoimidazole carboxamide ribotide isomerase
LRKLTVKLLPVLDLKNGQVVHAIAGRRSEYQPIKSQIAADSRPATVTRGVIRNFGCRELYVADLDAISGAAPDWTSYESVAACGVNLVVDAGIADPSMADAMRKYAGHHAWLTGIVLGLESIDRPEMLEQCVARFGEQRAVFSLDVESGRPRTRIAPLRELSPLQIADMAIAAGFRRLIVLELTSVGTGQGPVTAPLCRLLRSAHRDLELVSGGGVRSLADVHALLDAGCDQVLVASALHDGRLNDAASWLAGPDMDDTGGA